MLSSACGNTFLAPPFCIVCTYSMFYIVFKELIITCKWCEYNMIFSSIDISNATKKRMFSAEILSCCHFNLGTSPRQTFFPPMEMDKCGLYLPKSEEQWRHGQTSVSRPGWGSGMQRITAEKEEERILFSPKRHTFLYFLHSSSFFLILTLFKIKKRMEVKKKGNLMSKRVFSMFTLPRCNKIGERRISNIAVPCCYDIRYWRKRREKRNELHGWNL